MRALASLFGAAACALLLAACQDGGKTASTPASAAPPAATSAPAAASAHAMPTPSAATSAVAVAPTTSSSAVPPAPSASFASTRPGAPPTPHHGRVLTKSFHSVALGVDKHYLVWLPAEYDTDTTKRWPVVYLLHGLGGDETNWVQVGGLPAAADAMDLQAIVVMPDGDDGFYTDWAAPAEPYETCLADHPPFHKTEKPESYCVKLPRYEKYIAGDLVKHVDATYRTLADRKGRALTGVSMGGFGALELALRHQDEFSSVASHSGLVALTYAGPHPYVAGSDPLAKSLATWGHDYPANMREHMKHLLGDDIAAWRARDPSVLAASLKDGVLSVYLDCGTEDGYHFDDQALYLHEVLLGAGVKHVFALVPGQHLFKLWKQRIRESLAFHAAHFRDDGL